MLRNIKDLPMASLQEAVISLGLKPFTAVQLAEWLYKNRISSFEAMSSLSKEVLRKLSERFFISTLKVISMQTAADNTKKFLFELKDGKKIEAVRIPAESGRLTICLSTQVGCAMDCKFCRTGEMGLLRNLSQSEILDQVLEIQKQCEPETITNLVFMGMGEPMANLKALLPALEILQNDKGFAFPKRKITVSTSGLVPKMYEFVEKSDVKLAISLHAPNDKLRNQIMPINKRYPLSELMRFCKDYHKKSRHSIGFEYVMLKGINDKTSHLKETIQLLKGIRSKVNLISFNPFPGSPYEPSSPETMEMWRKSLLAEGIQTNVRKERGREILAACGQLAA